MIDTDSTQCPNCNGRLIKYGHAKRTLLSKYRKKYQLLIPRKKCKQCGKVHRELPEYIRPYKHYDSRIISAVENGVPIDEYPEYESYPSESTLNRWKSDGNHEK